MPRSFSTSDLVVLPRLDAASAIALSQSIESAVRDKELAKLLKDEPAIIETAQAAKEGREALQASLGAAGVTASPTGIRAADSREDTAIRALHGGLFAWALLKDELPEGKQADTLLQRVFGDGGLSFIQLPVKQEWAIADSKLRLIESEGLAPALARLGLQPIYDHLRAVHEHYGQVIGITKAPQREESPAVQERRRELVDTLRDYVLQVSAAARRRKKPLPAEAADALLRPIAEWQPPETTRPADKPAPPPPGPATPPTA